MATNMLSKTRRQFCTVKTIAEELDVKVQGIYRILKNPAMSECVQKIGPAGIRIDKEKFYDLLGKVYR